MKYNRCRLFPVFVLAIIVACGKDNAEPNPPQPPVSPLPDPVITSIYPNAAPKNKSVIINLDRLLTDRDSLPTRVWVNGTLVDFVVNRNHSQPIVFTVKKGIGSGPVEVEWKGKKLSGVQVSLTYDSLYYISRVAGSGTAGSENGPAATAQFFRPEGIVVDADGNIFVSEPLMHRIRKISSDGQVSTFAGSGTPGKANGQGTAASFNQPGDLAIDKNGNIFVADYNNQLVRKITPAGEVSTYAELNSYTWGIRGLDVDGAGVVYGVSGDQVFKITMDQQHSFIAGNVFSGDIDGIGTNAYFSNPQDIAVAPDGNLYVCESGNNKIRKVTQAGVVTTFAGGGGINGGYINATGTYARFWNPTSIFMGPDNILYVTEFGNEIVRMVDQHASVGTFAGRATYFGYRDDTLASAALFNALQGVTVDAHKQVYVTDSKNHRIRKIVKE